jgi:hypothetical protein
MSTLSYKILILTITYLLLRIFLFIDVTDEMQYYGQILSLQRTGMLFYDDLFIQQLPYILIYHLNYLWIKFYGIDYFIIFNRTIFAVLLFVLYFYWRNILKSVYREFKYSEIFSLILVVNVGFHGIFTLNYNTGSMIIWTTIFLTLLSGKYNRVSTTITPLLCLFHLPSLFVAITLQFIFIFANYRDKLLEFILSTFISLAIIVVYVFQFTNLENLKEAYNFSKSFGVGTFIFSDITQSTTTIVFIIISILVLFIGYNDKLNVGRLRINLELLTILVSVLLLFVFIIDLVQFQYSWAAFLAILGYWTILNFEVYSRTLIAQKAHINRINIVIIIWAMCVGVTSGNGIGQATPVILIGSLILMIESYNIRAKLKLKILNIFNIVTIVTLQLVVLLFYPYRSQSFFEQDSILSVSGPLKGLITSSNKSNLIQNLRTDLYPITFGKRVVIFGQLPVAYLLLNVTPATCMFYLHSLPNHNALARLQTCLGRKNPEQYIFLDSAMKINYLNDVVHVLRNELQSSSEMGCSSLVKKNFNAFYQINICVPNE